MAYENNDKKNDSVYSARIRAGKRRTYFFDVRATRANDYYLTITESRKRFNDDGYDRHKIFLYKEDFNKFIKGLTESIEYVKTDLMPDFDFDAFSHDTPYEPQEGTEAQEGGEGHGHTESHSDAHSQSHTDPGGDGAAPTSHEETSSHTTAAKDISKDIMPTQSQPSAPNHKDEEVDKW